MYRKWFKVRGWTWAAGVGALLVLGAFTAAMAATSRSKINHATPWYAESGSPEAGVLPAGQATAGQPNEMLAKMYANALSEAFHDAASKVLPAVVTITNTPAAREQPKEEKPSPDGNSEQVPFRVQGHALRRSV